MGTQDNFWGELIVELRIEQKVSQRGLAAGAKVNRSTLRRIEDGRTKGEVDILERILDFLGYDLEATLKDSVDATMKKRIEQESNPNHVSKMAALRLLRMTSAELRTS